jgi:hypothetical protein
MPEGKTVEKPPAEIMPEEKQLKNLRQKLCRRQNSWKKMPGRCICLFF